MTDTLSRRQRNWTRYWASGAAHSCGSSYGEFYGGAIGSFWRMVHDATPAGSRLLDVATGSGAIPRLWRSWRTSDDWDAVDLSNSAPSWIAEAGGRVRFHAGVQAESLPFPADSFDLVTSQYGIEYCDMALALPQVLRVLAPRGRVAFVMHHAGSRPISIARAELSALDWAFGPDGLVSACADVIDAVAESGTPQGRERLSRAPAAEAARVRFNAAQAALRELAAQPSASDVLGEIQDGVGAVVQLARQHGAPSARSAMDAWTSTLTDHRWRLRELCNHALDGVAARFLVSQLTSSALPAELGTLEEGSHLMGWTLLAVRSA